MTKNALFALAIGALFALGLAFAGWQAGLGVYSALYEMLRDSGREMMLESKRTLDIVRTCGWLLGLGLGAFAFSRWHRSGALEHAGFSVKRLAVLALAGAGATHLGYVLINGAGASVEVMVLACFAFLIGGSALAAGFFGTRPVRFFAGRFAVAALAAVAVLGTSLAFDKAVSQRYDSVERKRDVWVRIRVPQGTSLPPRDSIKVEMRTPAATVKGFATAWEDVDARPYLPVNFGYTEMTNDRTLTVTMPGRPDIVIKLPFARNPVPMHDYSPWIELPDGLSYRYRVN